ncbi:MAG: hypothetical protein A3J54_03445 [Candidatus Ryanbacteria bacterium RIFCSPHIGHO2_02_FULL_45_13b]|uniref:Uncharacterized protein n=1 Tax=Candidatus Ryanbacteria bacterium RIFCSPHIGHO2_02_FULL_45_13b TaxID=1802117 RepID=A0A1G2GB98_9BACT|nr:MAG: hypothetical protein A3J54_03445 [Candidatus Ryanbacteria bacterium RIFCSPHIGHO2_02_FULL_45_13b]
MIQDFLVQSAYAAIPPSPTLGDIIKVTWNDAIRPAVIFLFILATVVFIWGLIEFIANAASEDGRKRGKQNIVYGIVGMSIMLATGAILLVLNNFFTSVNP